MTTSSEHIAARDDIDLQRRLIAVAEQNGVPNAASAVASKLGELVSRPIMVGDQETSLTKMHAYAVAQTTPPPGANLAIMTDDALRAAVDAVLPAE